MTNKDIENYIEEEGLEEEEIMLFDSPSYADAFIGISSRNVAVYDYTKMLDCLISDGMTEEDAEDFVQYNTVGAYFGDKTPIILYPMEER